MTTMLPFASKQTLSPEQHQVLALAAIFQATQLVHLIATSGSHSLVGYSPAYATTLLQAAMNIRAQNNPNPDSMAFFHSIKNLRLGLHALEQSLTTPYNAQAKQNYPKLKLKSHRHALKYAMALISLSSKVYRNSNYQQQIDKAQRQILKQLAFFDYSYQHPAIINAFAQLYSDTASQLKPKVMVQGAIQSFQDPQQVATIRALLFSGLQAAHYWREQGGRPWKLIFSKNKILKELKYFAQLQHEQRFVDDEEVGAESESS